MTAENSPENNNSSEQKKGKTGSFTMFILLWFVAIIGRDAFAFLPSVEPIIPLAVAVGLIYGAEKGALFGGSAYAVSTLFMSGLSPWVLFQAIGGILAGGSAKWFGRVKKPILSDLVVWSIIGTLIFETIMNISGALMGYGPDFFGAGIFSVFAYFITSLPFSITHVVSNIFFALLCVPLLGLNKTKNENSN